MDNSMDLSVSKLNSLFVSYCTTSLLQQFYETWIMHISAQHRLEYWVTEQLLENFSLPSVPKYGWRSQIGSIPVPHIWEKSFPKKFQFPIPLGKIRSSPRLASPNFEFFNNFITRSKVIVSNLKSQISYHLRRTTLRSSSHQVQSVLHHLISGIPHRRFSRDRCCEYLACWPVRRSDFLVQHSVQINSLIEHELF